MPSTLQAPSRRTFLKVGLIGGLVLAGAGGTYRLLQQREPSSGFQLDQDAHQVLAAIIPVVLKGASAIDVEASVERVQHAISNLPLATQNEVQELFSLLSLAPARRFLAGLRSDWPQASEDEVASFLQSWRLSRFALFQSAYHALHDLITGSWYADESTWSGIGYPGPMKELS